MRAAFAMLAAIIGAGLSMGAVTTPIAPRIEPVHDRAATSLALFELADASLEGDVPQVAANSLLLTESADPTDVAEWWDALGEPTRATLADEAPSIIGNLDGVPYPVRDAANRQVLASELRSATTASASAGRGEALQLEQHLAALHAVQEALVVPAGGPARSLVTLGEESGSAVAAVAVGDLQSATSVDFLVPGMYFTVQDQLVDWTNAAANVQSEQASWLGRFGSGGSAAVVSWIGYQTPTVLTVLSLDRAEVGAAKLAEAVNGVKAARAGDEPFIGLLAHSYGATATMLALESHAMSVDALALVGAPGSTAASAGALDVPKGAVYVGEAPLDGIATSGFFGNDPAAPGWGGVELGANGGVDPITHIQLAAAIGHNGYFSAGTESLRNLALIGLGLGKDVTSGTTVPSGVLALSK